ncbi:MAG: alkaline phosphatase family protein, partial [Actinomycetota bacterium]|nr:alkaline phosphatase family protein [Actinomycetota bacterium]
MLRDLASAVWSVLVAGLGVTVGLAVVGGVVLRSSPLLLTALASGFFALETVISPVLRRLASLGSVLLALVLGVAAQLVLLAVVLVWAVGTPGLGWGDAVTVLVVAAGFLALGRWLVGATDSGYVVGAATGRTGRFMTAHRRSALRAVGEDTRGLLVVQLDGVSAPVLRHAIEGGQAPNLSRWIGTSHTLTQWWSTIPSTTPASMAGILHGDDEQVPAFRWWDREAGRLLAASRPADSRLVEGRFRSGQGLLRGGGTAISTTYGGEAEHAYLTISRTAGSRSLGSGATYFSFFARPFLLPGAMVLTLGEMVKEIYQANRQKVRGVEPRISRAGSYIAVRGITNVLLRKLNLSLLAQEMAAGRPVVFVDFVDYDEIAHHAGPERPEALRALEGLDAVLGSLRDVARSCVREYELVVVSDHGQSLGPTFEQVSGNSLVEHVAGLMDGDGGEPGDGHGGEGEAGDVGDVTRVERSAGEEWGPVNALVASVLARWGGVD